MLGQTLFEPLKDTISLMSKIVVIGQGSLIAQELIKRYAARGRSVVCTSSSKRAGSIHLDLRSESRWDLNFIKDNDFVVFLAAMSSPDFCEKEFEEAHKINVDGTVRLIRELLDLGSRVLFFSSDTVYGESKDSLSVFDEDSSPKPHGNYAKMKFQVENSFMGEKNFRVFRCSYVFSYEDKFTSMVLKNISNGETIEVFDPMRRNVIWIEDLLDAIEEIETKWKLFTHPICNIVGPDSVSRLELAEWICEVAKSTVPIEIIKPGAKFFLARPRQIYSSTLFLRDLIGRCPLKVKSAINRELQRRI